MQKPKPLGRQIRLKRQLGQAQQLKKKVRSLNSMQVLLSSAQPGFLEPQNQHQKTYTVSQKEIQLGVSCQTSSYAFKLDLQWGSYKIDHSRSGSHLLLGSSKGHVGLLGWRNKDLICQLFLEQRIRDLTFLNNESLFALAQRKHVFIYDRDGVQVHRLQLTNQPQFLQYLPFHYLLVVLSNLGFITYQDVSTGLTLLHHRTKGRHYTAIAQNQDSAVINTADSAGRVCMFTPSSGEPVVKLLAHQSVITSIAAKGNILITAGNEGLVKLWDIRTLKELHVYSRRPGAYNLAISQQGLLAMSAGNHVQIWKDHTLIQKMEKPYMRYFPSRSTCISDLKFVPYEDVLSVGSKAGYESIIVPGSAAPTYDYFDANPFQTKKQRQQSTVHKLMDKLPPSSISLSNNIIGTIDQTSKQILQKQAKQQRQERLQRQIEKKGEQFGRQRREQERRLEKASGVRDRLLEKRRQKEEGDQQMQLLAQIQAQQGFQTTLRKRLKA